MEKATRRSFSSEFRDAAVRRVMEHRERIADTARRLGISEKTLGNWVYAARRNLKPSEAAAPVKTVSMSLSEMEMEIDKLRLENTQLKIDKEILKKAAAFFVKEL